MKRFFFFTFMLSFYILNTQAQCGGTSASSFAHISIGIVIYSDDSETIWNALRLANYSVSSGDTVYIFLLGKGVELDSMEQKNANIKEQTDMFLKSGGKILACGTCLQSRNNNSPKVCSVSTMSDLYEMIRKSKVVLTF